MQRSSPSVAALASALAKAQAELTNPEKAHVAVLPAEPGRTAKRFRYASLSAGLDVVRQAFGRHEIAIIQATSFDRDTSSIKLTTTLAHASGEWVASDWPVCPLADLQSPHRMGSALTYARRYSLFTLAGIAGDDDLDAPDLRLETTPTIGATDSPDPPASTEPSAGAGSAHPARAPSPRRPVQTPARAVLGAGESKLRLDQLLAELRLIGSANEAAIWAKRIMPIKNALQREHALELEAAFERLLVGDAGAAPVPATPTPPASAPPETLPDQQTAALPASSVVEATVMLGYPRRHRDKAHLKFVASQPCLICNRSPCDAHHLKFAQPTALGRKVSDEFTVPLCRTHHRQLHRTGRETHWWAAFTTIEPLKVAKELWEKSRNTGGLN